MWAQLFVLFCSLISAMESQSLSCYKCIRLVCLHDVEVCKVLEKDITEKAKVYYQITSQLDVCPDPEPSGSTYERWSFREQNQKAFKDSRCDTKQGLGCSASRFEIHPEYLRNTTTGKRLKGPEVEVVYGTIFGCSTHAQRRLLDEKRSAASPASRDWCASSPEIKLDPVIYPSTTSDSTQGQGHETTGQTLTFEHCTSSFCYSHFCIDKTLSVPKRWTLDLSNSRNQTTWIALGVLGFVLCIICVYISGEFCGAEEERIRAIGGMHNITHNYHKTFFSLKKGKPLK